MKPKAVCFLAVLGALSLLGTASYAEDRGYMGVFLAPVPEVLAAHVGTKDGAVVDSIVSGSPAEKAGLRRYDVIVNVNGEKVKGPEEVRKMIQASKPGDTLKLAVRRGTDSLDIQVVLGSPLPSTEPQEGEKAKEREKEKEEAKRGFLGVGTAEVPAVLANHLGLEEGAGVLVRDVWKGSPAEKVGIEKDDVITHVDGHEVKGGADFLHLLSDKKAGDELKIDLIHKGAKKTVQVSLAERPGDLPRRAAQPSDRWFYPYDGRVRRPGAKGFGRIILEGPEGMEHVIPFPVNPWNLEDFGKDFEDQLQKLQEWAKPGVLGERVKKLMRELDQKFHDEGFLGDFSPGESHRSVVRIVEGDYDITLRDENGDRTVTVKQGDKVLAENLPYEKVGTLPQDVREKVEKAAAENLKDLLPADLPRESKIKA